MYQWYVNGQLVKNACYMPLEKRRKHQYIIRVKKLLTRYICEVLSVDSTELLCHRIPQDDSELENSKWHKIVSFIQKYTCDPSRGNVVKIKNEI